MPGAYENLGRAFKRALATLVRLQQHTLVLCLAVATGCASDETIETTYDPCSPLVLVLTGDVGDAELAGVEGAITAWQRVVPIQIMVGARDGATAALPIDFESGGSPYRAMYWDAFGEISINRTRLAPEHYALAVAHEMGHAFGLPHVAARTSVMNVGNLEIAPTEDDAAAVRAVWASCN